jgi:hypothetical protein
MRDAWVMGIFPELTGRITPNAKPVIVARALRD